MIWSGETINRALGVSGPSDSSFLSISTDTRTMAPDCLFVALVGERFDAHDHLDRAVSGGARGAVVRRDTPDVDGLLLYRVHDTLDALGRIGAARRHLIGGPVVSITGTNGKTSTKEMVARALAQEYATYATRENRNNLVGVPLSILEAPDNADALVLECGTNERGELRRLRDITSPTVGVVTNVSRGHLAGFDSLAGVLDEKTSLLMGVPVAVVGTDPAALGDRATDCATRLVVAGLDRRADVHPERWELDGDGHVVLRYAGRDVRLPVAGRHQGDNAMIALAVAEACGVGVDVAMPALETVTLPGGRCELLRGGDRLLLNDTYNANPASVLAALDTADAMRGARRLVVVVGSMLELGATSASAHEEIARAILERSPYLIGATGEFAVAFRSVVGDSKTVVTAADVEALGAQLLKQMHGDEFVLLKASRGERLERLIPLLLPEEEVSCSTTS